MDSHPDKIKEHNYSQSCSAYPFLWTWEHKCLLLDITLLSQQEAIKTNAQQPNRPYIRSWTGPVNPCCRRYLWLTNISLDFLVHSSHCFRYRPKTATNVIVVYRYRTLITGLAWVLMIYVKSTDSRMAIESRIAQILYMGDNGPVMRSKGSQRERWLERKLLCQLGCEYKWSTNWPHTRKRTNRDIT